MSHLLAKGLDKPLRSQSFKSSLLVSIMGFVPDLASLCLFLESIFCKLYDGISVAGLVVTKLNYVTLKINCQVIDGTVKRNGCRLLVNTWH